MQTLSVCMIVKNEQEFIEECLQSVRDVADEIIVVDTGCTDRTIEIATNYKAKIFSFDWVDDFSAARNESIKYATGDWILWLDADERLRPESMNQLKQLLKKEKRPTAYVLPIWNMLADKKNYKISDAHRLFTNHKGLSFTGRVHEQIVQSLAERNGQVRECTVTLLHLGYGLDESAQQKKIRRNRLLLEKMVKDEPKNAYAHFTLAQNYSGSFEWDKAVRHYQIALAHQRFDPGMVASLLNTYGEALMKTGRSQKAREMALKSLSKIKEQGGAYYLLFKLAESAGKKEEALDWLLHLYDATIQLRTSPKQLSTDILLDTDDVIYEIFKLNISLGNNQKALEWLRKLAPEKRNTPDLLLKAAELHLKQNEFQLALEQLLNPVLKDHPTALDLLGFVYMKQQNWKEAASVYEKLLKKDANNANIIRRLAGVYAKNGQMEKTRNLVEMLNSIED